MSTQKLFGLPPVSPELKPILPFLQRAEELKRHEPIIAYWCAYYAAQVGISLKARDNLSRDLLLSLLGVLEHMKKEIGNVDAIEVEAVSAAFVENFALKVFQSADNEDRKGAATKTTAKKFLAASNFLEVLRTFPKAEVSDSNEEKIRYAKWKAADIAKALREGRKPAPGPADQEPHLLTEDNTSFTERSTASSHLDQHDISSPPAKHRTSHHRDGSGASTNSLSETPPKAGKVSVSEDVEGRITPSSSPPRQSAMKSPGQEGSPEGKKRVHFSSSAEVVPILPPLPPKAPSPNEVYQGPPSIYAPQERSSPSPPLISTMGSSPPNHTNAPPPPSQFPQRTNVYAAPAHSSNGYSSSPPTSYPSVIPSSHSPPSADVPPLQVVELTPSLIAKAQRHCRFAISSLDYEDAEQAKKELRMALSILGGL